MNNVKLIQPSDQVSYAYNLQYYLIKMKMLVLWSLSSVLINTLQMMKGQY
jgi:hypothetical protein